jgi:FG-GAP repeat
MLGSQRARHAVMALLCVVLSALMISGVAQAALLAPAAHADGGTLTIVESTPATITSSGQVVVADNSAVQVSPDNSPLTPTADTSQCGTNGGGCLTINSAAATSTDAAPPPLIQVSGFTNGEPPMAPQAWGAIEQQAEATVADLRGVPADRRNRFWARPEIDALMYLRLIGIVEKKAAGTTLTTDEQDALTELTKRYNDYEKEVAQTARNLFSNWLLSPCNFQVPVGDPNSYIEKYIDPASDTLCVPTHFRGMFTGAPPPPSADQFTEWARDLVSGEHRRDLISLYGKQVPGTPEEKDALLALDYQNTLDGMQQGLSFLGAAGHDLGALSDNEKPVSENTLDQELRDAAIHVGYDRIADTVQSAITDLVLPPKPETSQIDTAVETVLDDDPAEAATQESVDNLVADQLSSGIESDVANEVIDLADTGLFVASAVLGAAAVVAVEAYDTAHVYAVQSTLDDNLDNANNGTTDLSGLVGDTNGQKKLVNVFAEDMLPSFIDYDRANYDAPDGPPPDPSADDPVWVVPTGGGTTPSDSIVADDWEAPKTPERVSIEGNGWVRTAGLVASTGNSADFAIPDPSTDRYGPAWSATAFRYVDANTGDWWRAWPVRGNLLKVKYATVVPGTQNNITAVYPDLQEGISTGIPCHEASFGAGPYAIEPSYTGYRCVVGSGTQFKRDLHAGDFVQLGNDIKQVADVMSDTAFETTTPFGTPKGHAEVMVPGTPLMRIVGYDANCWSDGNCQTGEDIAFSTSRVDGDTSGPQVPESATLGGQPPVIAPTITGTANWYVFQQPQCDAFGHCTGTTPVGQWAFTVGETLGLDAHAYVPDGEAVAKVEWEFCDPFGHCATVPADVTSGTATSVSSPFTAAGKWTVTARAWSAAPANKETQASFVINVQKGNQSIGAFQLFSDPVNPHAGTAAIPVTLSASSGLPVRLTSLTPSVCTTGGANSEDIAFDSAGDCKLALDQPGDANWNAAPQVLETVHVDPTQPATLTASDAAPNGSFGSNVAVSGDTMVATEPGSWGSVLIFQRGPSGAWTDDQEIARLHAPGYSGFGYHDSFGAALAIQGDTIVASDPAHNVVYVFTKPADGWSSVLAPTATLTASDGSNNDDFGSSVAIDGNTIVVGADTKNSSAGAAYVFTKPAGGWSDEHESAELTASDAAHLYLFGGSVAVSGTNIVVGSSGWGYGNDDTTFSGRAYLFSQQGGVWSTGTETAELVPPNPMAFAKFGSQVAIECDTIVAGAPDVDSGTGTGEIYRFDATGGLSGQVQGTSMTPSDEAYGDEFGWHVAINNGAIVASSVSAANSNGAPGAVYRFAPSGGTYTETKFTPPDGNAKYLGYGGVAATPDAVLADAPNATVDGNDYAGAVYAFNLSAAVATRNVDAPHVSLTCGDACPISGNTVSDGAPLHVDNGLFVTQSGTTYTYQWQSWNGKKWSAIAKATTNNYVVPAMLTGSSVRAVVTAVDPQGHEVPAPSDASFNVVPPPPLSVTAVVTCGTATGCRQPHFGSKLGVQASFLNSGWNVPDHTNATPTWYWCSGVITATCNAVANGNTYTPTAPPAGARYLRVRVAATYAKSARAANPTATAWSDPVVLTQGPVPAAAPVVTCGASCASVIVGTKLTTSNGKFTFDIKPLTTTYQWQRCGVLAAPGAADPGSCYEIPGATSKTYTASLNDNGYYLAALVTGTDGSGAYTNALSNATPQVALPVKPSTKVAKISGTPKVGVQLSAVASWTSPVGFDVSYQWNLCDGSGANCAPIAAPAGQQATYTPVASDVGHKLTVQFVATDVCNQSASATSAATAAVKK